MVARAVSLVRMIVHCAGFTFGGQVGATSGVFVWLPSSRICATAGAATMASPSMEAANAALKWVRLIMCIEHGIAAAVACGCTDRPCCEQDFTHLREVFQRARSSPLP